MNACNHPLRQRDRYGETCLLCGETLAGYGCLGEAQNHCKHIWNRIDALEVCRYCDEERRYDPLEKKVALALIRAARKANPTMLALIETWLVAKVSPRDIEALARSAGSRHPEQWYLVAKYFYDPQPERDQALTAKTLRR